MRLKYPALITISPPFKQTIAVPRTIAAARGCTATLPLLLRVQFLTVSLSRVDLFDPSSRRAKHPLRALTVHRKCHAATLKWTCWLGCYRSVKKHRVAIWHYYSLNNSMAALSCWDVVKLNKTVANLRYFSYWLLTVFVFDLKNDEMFYFDLGVNLLIWLWSRSAETSSYRNTLYCSLNHSFNVFITGMV